ncbi:MAG: hypothetical protein A3E78_09685 [Alphaproteobacteria bacterium RIFCSPHIGHO2_12_FULL_63_12]|nr:MAG: hypothetical protein A3E78_09685 [Alphaproteobacteria bacterium RIFCSPHIGHO2_12_FULL_63_12]
MTKNSDDLALETLLAVREEIAPRLNEDLVRRCYAIQKNHQFDKDRAVALREMERLIEEEVERRSAAGEGGTAA